MGNENKTQKFMDQEVAELNLDIFKKGKLRCIIIYPTQGHKEYFVKIDSPYFVTIKGKKYFLSTKCLIAGKKPTMLWYYNNPNPILLTYETSTLTALDLYTEDEKEALKEEVKEMLGKVHIDGDIVHHGFENTVMKNFYQGGGMTAKSILIYGVVFIAVILTILHFAGVIDMMSILGVGGK